MNFSVLMSVYNRDKASYLNLALESLLNQSVRPSEIVLIKDGPLTSSLEQCLRMYQQRCPGLFKIVSLEINKGLGAALHKGLQYCSNSLIARMDADDQCYFHRFEKQLAVMRADPAVAVLGTSIEEFRQHPGDLKQYRRLPQNSEDIRQYARYRNPMNHPSVMFRKEAVLAVGSYQDMPLFEDYYLWVRLLLAGYKFQNLPDTLLYFRIGNDMIGRRSGIQYVKKEYHFLKSIKQLGFINQKEYFISLFTKQPLRLLPKRILVYLYKFLLRKRKGY
ncbi:glycosyltransferase [Olivibacter sp. CPCC 100613]|uniref:glycosyltransferase n=1 Tax=Olivibacter sp. CPCC 100613 TaxID=3079931 RepID=UPI002FFBCFB0